MKSITYFLYVCILAVMGYITFLSYGLLKSEQVPYLEKKGAGESTTKTVTEVPDERPIQTSDEVTSS